MFSSFLLGRGRASQDHACPILLLQGFCGVTCHDFFSIKISENALDEREVGRDTFFLSETLYAAMKIFVSPLRRGSGLFPMPRLMALVSRPIDRF
jgi:hypothetical protein